MSPKLKSVMSLLKKNLTETQKIAGWVAQLRTVDSWDEVPVNALKLN